MFRREPLMRAYEAVGQDVAAERNLTRTGVVSDTGRADAIAAPVDAIRAVAPVVSTRNITQAAALPETRVALDTTGLTTPRTAPEITSPTRSPAAVPAGREVSDPTAGGAYEAVPTTTSGSSGASTSDRVGAIYTDASAQTEDEQAPQVLPGGESIDTTQDTTGGIDTSSGETAYRGTTGTTGTTGGTLPSASKSSLPLILGLGAGALLLYFMFKK